MIGHDGRIAVKYNAGLAVEGIFFHFSPNFQSVFDKSLGGVAITYPILFTSWQVDVAECEHQFVFLNTGVQTTQVGNRFVGADRAKWIHIQNFDSTGFQSAGYTCSELDGAGWSFAIVLEVHFVIQIFAFGTAKADPFVGDRDVVRIV